MAHLPLVPRSRGWLPAAFDATFGGGPAVALVLQRGLALVYAVAFASLAAQLDVLIGHQGILPAEDLLRTLHGRPDLSFLDAPTHLWSLGPPPALGSDALPAWRERLELALHLPAQLAVVVAGLAAVFGWTRPVFAVLAPLYLSYAVAGQTFLAFQWDQMLVECGLVALMLPVDRPARIGHVVLRLLLFKLYFESGIAKWQSHLGDWHDGTAMLSYYETAPLPTPLAWFAHHLPAGWHAVETWAALGLELVVPWLVFGPRAARLTAFVAFTAFQLTDLSTANYGFFCYLSLLLHVSLLDHADVRRVLDALGRMTGREALHGGRDLVRAGPLWWVRGAGVTTALVAALWGVASLAEATAHFTRPAHVCERLAARSASTQADVGRGPRCWSRPDWLAGALASSAEVRRAVGALRVANAYHLFGHITTERIEPQFEVRTEAGWRPLAMRYKAGPTERAPPVVAPHQPRVDFRLWFYGLAWQRRTPRWIQRMLRLLCDEPAALDTLFVGDVPRAASAARITFWRYRFTDPDPAVRVARGETGWWRRERLGDGPLWRCQGRATSASSTTRPPGPR